MNLKKIGGWVAAGVISATLLACGLGESSSSSEEPGSAPAANAPADKDAAVQNMPLGRKLVVKEADGDTLAITVSASKKWPKPLKKACQSLMPKPTNGLFLVYDVTFEVTKGDKSINPLDLTYVAPDGTTDDGVSGAFSGCGKGIEAGIDFPAGTKRSGQIVFDVKAAKGRIEFREGLDGGAAGSWKIG